jgi:uncharacterized protein (DUF433 family)
MAQILTTSRYIVRDEETLLKEPIVAGTQVTVRDIVELWRSGALPQDIPTRLFNLISAAQVFDAIRFYLDNQSEIDGYIEWYHSRPPLNVPVELRLNPLRDEVDQAIQATRQAEKPVHDRASDDQ